MTRWVLASTADARMVGLRGRGAIFRRKLVCPATRTQWKLSIMPPQPLSCHYCVQAVPESELGPSAAPTSARGQASLAHPDWASASSFDISISIHQIDSRYRYRFTREERGQLTGITRYIRSTVLSSLTPFLHITPPPPSFSHTVVRNLQHVAQHVAKQSGQSRSSITPRAPSDAVKPAACHSCPTETSVVPQK